ncbi:MAG: hypothetical protein R3305_12135 [Gammaproteobacteria bacterium]|nr:hypothetical protein [Gammaproteobacteria bacterium]
MAWLTNIWTARVLVIAGFLAGWGSLGATVRHMGNDLFLLVAESPNGQTHSWHHFFRELGGDFGAMAAILVILFAAPKYRTPVTWWVMLILMIGFYAPFWVGVPFMAELAAPSRQAEINHLMMAVPALLGCFAAWPDFFKRRGAFD